MDNCYGCGRTDAECHLYSGDMTILGLGWVESAAGLCPECVTKLGNEPPVKCPVCLEVGERHFMQIVCGDQDVVEIVPARNESGRWERASLYYTGAPGQKECPHMKELRKRRVLRKYKLD